jgi:hypothetical protein
MAYKARSESKARSVATKKTRTPRPQKTSSASGWCGPCCWYRVNKSNGAPFSFVVVKAEVDGKAVDLGSDSKEFETREAMTKAIKAQLGTDGKVMFRKFY